MVKASRLRRLLQNLAFSLAVFLLCILFCEVALRFAGYGHLEIYEPDAKLYWKLKPNQDCFTKVNHQPVHINAQGTRGPEFSPDKPANTFRILSLGDSRTFGWGLADEQTYSRKVEKLLGEYVAARKPLRMKGTTPTPTQEGSKTVDARQQFPSWEGSGVGLGEQIANAHSWSLSPADGERGNRRPAFGAATRVEVINAGVNAWSYPQVAVYFRDVGLRYQPDLVILAEANLWTQFSEKNDPAFVSKFLWRVRLKNFLRRFAIYHYVIEVKLRDLYEQNRTKFIPVDPKQDALFKEQQQGNPDLVFRSAIEEVCRTARSNHVQPVLLFLPTLDDLQSTNPSRVLLAKRSVSIAIGAPLVDLTPDLAGPGQALYLDADPVHLNAPGNALVAERLFESVTNVLAR